LVDERPDQAVTVVENHDVVCNDSIVTDKMLAYAFILTHQGNPSVFWQDWGTGTGRIPQRDRGAGATARGLRWRLDVRALRRRAVTRDRPEAPGPDRRGPTAAAVMVPVVELFVVLSSAAG
jgi:hypothetical protein